MGYTVKSIQKWGKERYIIVDETTGKVLDDAQGFGYKTPKKAHKAWAFKQLTPEQQARRKGVKKWLEQHQDMCDTYIDDCFFGWKNNIPVTEDYVESLLKEYNLFDDCPFTVKEIFRGLNRL